MQIKKWLLPGLVACVVGMNSQAFAQTPDLSKQETAINDISALFKLWKTTKAEHSSDIKDFVNYFYNVKKTDDRYNRLYHRQFINGAYLPFYVLKNGGFIMRRYSSQTNNSEVTFEVDVDGEASICPDYPEQTKLNVNDKGEVYVAP